MLLKACQVRLLQQHVKYQRRTLCYFVDFTDADLKAVHAGEVMQHIPN